MDVPSRPPVDLRPARRRHRRAGPRPARGRDRRGDRVGIWSPNCAEWVLLQYATAKIGAILVNINPAYRSHELGYVLRQSGVRLLVSAESFKTSDYRGDDRRGERPTCAGLRAGRSSSARRTGTTLLAAGRRAAAGGRAGRAREAELAFDDPINIQYTSGHDRLPQGRDPVAPQHPEQRLLHRRGAAGYTERDRVCIPVPFYHCFGMVLGNLACTTHGACIVIPAPGFDPARHAGARCRPSGARRCTACRPCSSPSWPCPTSPSYDLSTLRTGIMAGSPCPVEVMKRVVSEMHMAEVTICYGMTETSPVSTQTRPTTTWSAGCRPSAGCTRTSRSRSSTRRPAWCCRAARPGELCTRGYSVMLGYWDEPEKTAEAIDAARWMHTGDLAVMDDGRLPEHRRPDQGHGHPRRRERLPARGRGVPLQPTRRSRTSRSIGVPGREVRRGAVRLGEAAARRRADRRGASGRSARARSRTTRSRGTCGSPTSSR